MSACIVFEESGSTAVIRKITHYPDPLHFSNIGPIIEEVDKENSHALRRSVIRVRLSCDSS